VPPSAGTPAPLVHSRFMQTCWFARNPRREDLVGPGYLDGGGTTTAVGIRRVQKGALREG